MVHEVLHKEIFRIIKTMIMDQLVLCKFKNNLPPYQANQREFEKICY